MRLRRPSQPLVSARKRHSAIIGQSEIGGIVGRQIMRNGQFDQCRISTRCDLDSLDRQTAQTEQARHDFLSGKSVTPGGHQQDVAQLVP